MWITFLQLGNYCGVPLLTDCILCYSDRCAEGIVQPMDDGAQGGGHRDGPAAAQSVLPGDFAMHVQRDHEWHSHQAGEAQVHRGRSETAVTLRWGRKEDDWVKVWFYLKWIMVSIRLTTNDWIYPNDVLTDWYQFRVPKLSRAYIKNESVTIW